MRHLRKAFATSLAAFSLLQVCGQAMGQEAVAGPPTMATPPTNEAPKLTPAQLDDLTAPIALYPDPLVAQILAASTYPADIVLAQREIAKGATADALEAQPWDPSVVALTHYPTILKMMDENLEWTQQLGEAFARQQSDVMSSIQRLRMRAEALGNLRETPEQRVVVEDAAIQIVPASPEVIYVPTYDPVIVYTQPCYSSWVGSPYISFGIGFGVGTWLNLGCDWWGGRCCYTSGWYWSHWGYPYRSWGWCGTWFPSCAPIHNWHGHGWSGGHDGGHHFSDGRHGRSSDASPRAWRRDSSRPFEGHRSFGSTTNSFARDFKTPLRSTPSVADRVRMPGDSALADRGAPGVDSRRVSSPGKSRDSYLRSTRSSVPQVIRGATPVGPGPRVRENTITPPSRLDPSTIKRSGPGGSGRDGGSRIVVPRNTRRSEVGSKTYVPDTSFADRRSTGWIAWSRGGNGASAGRTPSTISVPRTARIGTPSTRSIGPSAGPGTPVFRNTAPSPGRQGLNRAPSPGPRVAPTGGRQGFQRSSAPARSAPASRGSSPSFRRSK